ncbi:hypothetical protein GmHk_05G013347 [Glycine max]|nr:hypothetical protein GmHk_05G013347 [Glycine max]
MQSLLLIPIFPRLNQNILLDSQFKPPEASQLVSKQRRHSLVWLLPFLSLWCLTDENLCHSLEGNVGALTNFEVLDFLRAKGASKDPTRVITKVAQSEYKVYDYLVNTPASIQTRESINEFLTSVKQYDLAKVEVLNILNIEPVADFELYPVIYYQTVFDKSTSTLFVASDQAGKVPLFWGITTDGYVAFADDVDLLKGSCGKSLASFPQGCFYCTAVGGLRCNENPKNKITKIPVEEEEIWGAFFKVTR